MQETNAVITGKNTYSALQTQLKEIKASLHFRFQV